jgi:hypothetical protein
LRGGGGADRCAAAGGRDAVGAGSEPAPPEHHEQVDAQGHQIGIEPAAVTPVAYNVTAVSTPMTILAATADVRTRRANRIASQPGTTCASRL